MGNLIESVKVSKINVELLLVVHNGTASVSKGENESLASTEVKWLDIGLPKVKHLVIAYASEAQDAFDVVCPRIDVSSSGGVPPDEIDDFYVDSEGITFRVKTPASGSLYASTVDRNFYYYVFGKDTRS